MPLKAARTGQLRDSGRTTGLPPKLEMEAVRHLSRSRRLLSAVHAWHRSAAKQQLQASLPTRRHGRLSSQILATEPTDDNREWVLSQASHFCVWAAVTVGVRVDR